MRIHHRLDTLEAQRRIELSEYLELVALEHPLDQLAQAIAANAGPLAPPPSTRALCAELDQSLAPRIDG